MMKRIPMTEPGFRKLKEELEHLFKFERPKNIKDIEEARSHGDLSENAEYHAAKERQSFIEGRIQELQSKTALAQVIDTSRIKSDRVTFGAKVKVYDLATDEERLFQLVGPDEADVSNGRISITSPVGSGLMSKEVGDTVVVNAPAKTIEYEIIEISFE
ncbi:MAG TPA: transcription elongation factor GreA [Nitrospirae bacterium]|nr:transcription elongation factor GreA [Nitrospirota bacterium]